MHDLSITDKGMDFRGVHSAMRRSVDGDLLPGVSSAVLMGADLVDLHCVGWADKEAGVGLRDDHLFRAFSNTKLITSMAALLLHERQQLDLDEPVDRLLPQLAARRVLRPGATDLNDTEAARGAITARHLLSHSAGLSYGLLDPGSTIFKAYTARKVMNPLTPLSDMLDQLAALPLTFHPGSSWEYSVATDVVARLIEVISGQGVDEFIHANILQPLGMVDTGFVVPSEHRQRMAGMYLGASLTEPLKPGLMRNDALPYPGAYVTPVPRLSGGGGLVSSLPDMVALVRSLMPGGVSLLKPETMAAMTTNQLAPGVSIRFPGIGEVPGKVYGLAGALTRQTTPFEPAAAVGEFQWGGIAGTHWWISPRHNLAGLVMTQRYMSFWHPFSFEIKREVYRAVGLA